MFAIEYYNPKRKDGHSGRFFKRPDAKDLKRAEAASTRWCKLEPRFTPQQEILPGDETDRLHRWGYRHYRDLFNDRQLLGLEASCRLVVAQWISASGVRSRQISRTCSAIKICYADMTPWP